MGSSQGNVMDWFKIVPKDLHDNHRFRKFLVAKASSDKGLQRALKELCKRDILFWFNAFVFTYDPRKKQKSIPFITYPFQDECILLTLQCIREGEHIVQPKSRTMGASWMDMGIF